MTISQHQLKQKMRGLIITVMRSVIKQPQIKAIALFILTKVPKTKAYLNIIALSGGLSTKQEGEDSITALNNEIGSVSLAKFPVSKITDIDYFASKIPQRLCQTYALNFDFELIEKIRQGQHLDYVAYSGDKLKLSIVHHYLALLYRFPSAIEIKQCSDSVINKSDFEPLMKTIRESMEYKQRGRKELIL